MRNGVDRQRHEGRPAKRIPPALLDTLARFRRVLLLRRAAAVFTLAAVSVAAAFWVLFLIDRMLITPQWLRLTISVAAWATLIGLAFRYAADIFRNASTSGIVATIRRDDLRGGDRLWGASELLRDQREQTRSRELCAAAIDQVGQQVDAEKLIKLLPPIKSRARRILLAALVCAILLLALVDASMVRNVAWRLADPLSAVPRATWTRIVPGAKQRVVPRGEPSRLSVAIDSTSRWQPRAGTLLFAGRTFTAEREGGNEFKFALPPLTEAATAKVRIGDDLRAIRVVPRERPELVSIGAEIQLPQYLSRSTGVKKVSADARGAAVSYVVGSKVTITGQADRPLDRVWIDGQPKRVDGVSFRLPVDLAEDVARIEWVDRDGLRCGSPVEIRLRKVEDRPPAVTADARTSSQQILNEQQLSFRVSAEDDYRIERIGIAWQSETVPGEGGERVLAVPPEDWFADADSLGRPIQLDVPVRPAAMDIPEGEIRLRFWAEDAFAGRGRIYSPSFTLNVMSPGDHAIWIAEQLEGWQQSALDLRDRELQLLETNQRLRQTPIEQRDQSWRDDVARQARAEEQNARLLADVVRQGEDLLRQAAGNREVAAESVQSLAESLQSLSELSDDRMPEIAELLKEAGRNEPEESRFAAAADQETSRGDVDAAATGDDQKEENQQSGPATDERLSLATTQVLDTSGKNDAEERQPSESLADAVDRQAELVSEFEKVADELRELLGGMEGSTLVKRFKSISRMQDRVAMALQRSIQSTFGRSEAKADTAVESAAEPAVKVAAESVDHAAAAVQDLAALVDRRDVQPFKSVLVEIQNAQLVSELERAAGEISQRPGIGIATAQYWADALDRWADDLVPRAEEQPESDSDSDRKQSVPPSVVLEVLRILQAQVDLRERTRAAERSRSALPLDEFMQQAIRLSEDQDLLRDRLDRSIDQLRSVPKGLLNFGAEIDVMSAASAAMVDSREVLVSPETGGPAIAAQTEAIELLLQSQKVGAESGGAGSAVAGGSAGGQTDEAALQLLGAGMNEMEVLREDRSEVGVGAAPEKIPARWRRGVQEYFNRLDEIDSDAPAGGE